MCRTQTTSCLSSERRRPMQFIHVQCETCHGPLKGSKPDCLLWKDTGVKLGSPAAPQTAQDRCDSDTHTCCTPTLNQNQRQSDQWAGPWSCSLPCRQPMAEPQPAAPVCWCDWCEWLRPRRRRSCRPPRAARTSPALPVVLWSFRTFSSRTPAPPADCTTVSRWQVAPPPQAKAPLCLSDRG